MAPPRYTALLLLVSLFLFLFCISHAATEAARSGSGQPLQEQHGEVEDLVAASFAEVEEQCGGGAAGGEEGEECLMRRTQMAHIDYYYYGNHN